MKTVTIKVSVPNEWSEAEAEKFFASQLKQKQNRQEYQAKRNAEFAEFRAAKKAQATKTTK